MPDAREPESERLRRARDQIERGKLKRALLTLWDEGEDARVTDDRIRLQAVAELALAVRDSAGGRVQASAGELIEHVERALASVPSAPPALPSSPPSGPLWPKFLLWAVGICLFVSLLIVGSAQLVGGYFCEEALTVAVLAIWLGGVLAAPGVGIAWIRRRRSRGAARGLFDYVVVPAVSLITAASAAAAVSVLMIQILLTSERCWWD